MGFNTVAMFLNDQFSSVERAPQSIIYGICHPPMGPRELEDGSWQRDIASYALEQGEGYPGFGNGIKILPTFHADNVHFLYAGKNMLESLRVHKFGKAKVIESEPHSKGHGTNLTTKTVNTVTLILPDWWSRE